MTVKEFCMAHGGQPGHVVNISDKFGFTSLQTVDGTCYLAFAKTQFPQNMSKTDVMTALKTKELDVLEGETLSGKPCFTIVEHSELYEAFDF